MLQELHITNFALLDQVDLEFGAGLNLLTGETGAGKSILVDALGLALGDRAGGDIIRTGADKATVEAIFDLADAPQTTRQLIVDAGIEGDDDSCLYVSREVTRTGKSQCRINGRLCLQTTLREICDLLVDIHGQHEHQSLLAVDKHIDLLDNWLGAEALQLRSHIADAYAMCLDLRRELDGLQADARERIRNLDLYRFQVQEITEAQLRPDEEVELLADKLRLANAAKLAQASAQAYDALAEQVTDGLNTASAVIARAQDMDPGLETISEQLNEALSYSEEARRRLRRYRDEVEINPVRLEEIEQRLNLLHTLKRKYGDTIEEIDAYVASLNAKLDGIEDQEARVNDLADAIVKQEARLADGSARLSNLRRQGSRQFAQGIACELTDLGMPAARFDVQIDEQAPTARGFDRVEFVLSPNPGEPLRPLARIASGGEVSRIMLAIKSVLARIAFVPTLIFDEIDSGIGGRTAAVIGQKLAKLSAQTQILCITHLPQIASRPASAHFMLEKSSNGERTVVSVRKLDDAQRVDEIARMLGGSPDQPTVVEHARQLLQREGC